MSIDLNELKEFGDNLLYYNEKSDMYYLVKRYSKDKDSINEMNNEIKLHEKLSLLKDGSEYFLKYIGPTETDDDKYIFYQLVGKEHMTLEDFLYDMHSNTINLNENEKFLLIHNLIKCIHVLHNNNIKHCNISPKNFIVSEKTKIKFIDFDRSCKFVYKSSYGYTPPEIITSLFFSGDTNFVYTDINKADIFILGIIILEIIWNVHPFYFINPDIPNYWSILDIFYKNYINNFVIDRNPSVKLTNLKLILSKMLIYNHEKRSDINTIYDFYKTTVHKTLVKIIPRQFGGYNILNEYVKEVDYGSGATGKVFRAHKQDRPNEKYVIKYIQTRTNNQKLMAENEIHNLLKIKTSGCKRDILCYHSHIKEKGGYYIITQLFREDTQNLYEFLYESPNSPDFKDKLQIMKNLANALEELHKIKIVHSDIKPENFLIDKNTLEIQLIDFGFSYDLESEKFPYFSGGTIGYNDPQVILSQEEINKCNKINEYNKTLEILQKSNEKDSEIEIEFYKDKLATSKCEFDKNTLYKYDIFSLGIIFYELINGNNPSEFIPFDGENWKNNVSFFYTHYELSSHTKYSELDAVINKMLKYNLRDRIGSLGEVKILLNNILENDRLEGIKKDISILIDNYKSIFQIYTNIPELVKLFVNFHLYIKHLEDILESEMTIKNIEQFYILEGKIDMILKMYSKQLDRIYNDISLDITNIEIYKNYFEKIKRLHKDLLYKIKDIIQ